MNPDDKVNTEQPTTTPEDGDKAFAAGYESPDTPIEAVGETKPSATETTSPPKEKTVAEEGKTTKVEEAPDPWKDVPKVVRDQLEQSAQFQRTASESLRNIGTTLQSLPQQIKDATAAATAAVKAEGGEAPTKTEVAAATKSSEKWARLKEDYPDWADAMEEQLADVRAAFAAAAPAPVDAKALRGEIEGGLTKAITPALQAVQNRARQLALLDFYHEDWEEIARSAPYAAWIKTQSADVQALEKSPLAKDGRKLFDQYKAFAKRAKTKEESETRLKNAETPTGTPRTTTEPIDNEDEAFRAGYAQA